MTSEPGVFAGGDAEHGPRTAVEAIRSGKIAATAIDTWLRGLPIDAAVGHPVRRDEVIPWKPGAGSHPPGACRDARKDRRRGPRRGQLRPDRGGPDRRDGPRRGAPLPALRHLHRLRPVHGRLQRDGRRGPADGRHIAGRLAYFDFNRPAELCIGCGACTEVCPTGAIHLEDRDGIRRTIITGTVVCEQPLL